MKLKLDFITNSSSVCFLIISSQKIWKKDLIEDGLPPSHIDYFYCVGDVKKLIEITEGKPCDWVKYARGPVDFWNISEEWYNDAKEIIESGNFAVFVNLNRDYPDEHDIFEDNIRERGLRILKRDWD